MFLGLLFASFLFGIIGSAISAERNWSQKQREMAQQDAYNKENMAIQQEYNKENMEIQQQYNEKMWNMNNEYNHPAAQSARFQAAGLNPLAMMGDAVGANGSGAVSSSNPTPFTFAGSNLPSDAMLPKFDALTAAQAANLDADTKLKQSQADNTDADTRSTIELLDGQKKLNESLSNLYDNQALESSTRVDLNRLDKVFKDLTNESMQREYEIDGKKYRAIDIRNLRESYGAIGDLLKNERDRGLLQPTIDLAYAQLDNLFADTAAKTSTAYAQHMLGDSISQDINFDYETWNARVKKINLENLLTESNIDLNHIEHSLKEVGLDDAVSRFEAWRKYKAYDAEAIGTIMDNVVKGSSAYRDIGIGTASFSTLFKETGNKSQDRLNSVKALFYIARIAAMAGK